MSFEDATIHERRASRMYYERVSIMRA